MNEREQEVVEAVRLETFETLMEGVKMQVGENIVEAGLDTWHCCILASRVAMDVLSDHFIGARAVKVQTLTMNRDAWAAESRGERGAEAPGGIIWGCGLAGDGSQAYVEEGWLNGHVVNSFLNEDAWVAAPLDDGMGGMLYHKHPDKSGVFDANDWLGREIHYAVLRDAVARAVKQRLA
jgi:hypothetical protein